MQELYYNGLLLTEENIKKLALANEIDRNFPYLDNAEIMFLAVMTNHSLCKLVSRRMLESFCRRIVDSNVSDETKKDFLFDVVEEIDMIPLSAEVFFKDIAYLRKMATKSLNSFIKTYRISRNPLLNDIFFELYEDDYYYNPDSSVSCALESPKVLLNDLQRGGYYIHLFQMEAYSDEVIDYLIEHKEFNIISNCIHSFPKFVIAKLKNNIDCFYKLPGNSITKEVVDYLKSIDFHVSLDKLSENYILAPDFLLMLLEENFDNLKYLKEHRTINDMVIAYLVNHNYSFKEGDFEGLLDYDPIIKSTVLNGNLDYLVMNNISLSHEMESFIVDYIISHDYDIKIIDNYSLLNNEKLNNYLKNKYQHPNLFSLPLKIHSSSVARNINQEFIDLFSYEVAFTIIDQIALNNYYLNLDGVFNRMPVAKFKELYDRLFLAERKIIQKFDFYYFIKVIEYFDNNLDLLNDLNHHELSDIVINNLSLAINNSDNVSSHHELLMYQNEYHERILSSSLDPIDKIMYLLINGNKMDALAFLDEVLNIDDAIYLQLSFPTDSEEYNYLESCIELITCLSQVMKLEDESSLNKLLNEIIAKYNMKASMHSRSLFDNIKDLYVKNYSMNRLDKESLRKKGKLEEIDDVFVYHLEGEDFTLFSHYLGFNKEDKYEIDSLGSLFQIKKNREFKYSSYICTTYESMFDPDGISAPEIALYEIDDLSTLIAFGNEDIFIKHTKRPLFTSKNCFLNRIDMSFFKYNNSYTDTEFDFLRMQRNNLLKKPNYITCGSKDLLPNYLNFAKENNVGIVCFDREKNKQLLYEMYIEYLGNIEHLNYLEIYKLIRLSVIDKDRKLSSDDIETILKRISELSEKEAYLLKSKLVKYGYSIEFLKDKYNIPRK